MDNNLAVPETRYELLRELTKAWYRIDALTEQLRRAEAKIVELKAQLSGKPVHIPVVAQQPK